MKRLAEELAEWHITARSRTVNQRPQAYCRAAKRAETKTDTQLMDFRYCPIHNSWDHGWQADPPRMTRLTALQAALNAGIERLHPSVA